MRLIRAALGELTDLELAYFALYTAPKLASQTEKKIWLYLGERRLNKTKAKALIELNESRKNKKGKQYCPECSTSAVQQAATATQKTKVWLTYSELVKHHNRKGISHWQEKQVCCALCETPIQNKTAPQPSVPGVRVFTNSLRS